MFDIEQDARLLSRIEQTAKEVLSKKEKGYFVLILDRKTKLVSIACNIDQRVVITKLEELLEELKLEVARRD